MANTVLSDLEQINALLNSLKNSINTARQALEQAPRGLTTWVADAERLVTMQQQYNRLLQEANARQAPQQTVLNRLQPSKGGFTGTPSGTPPPEIATLSPELEAAINALNAKKLNAEKQSLAAAERRKAAEDRRTKIAEKQEAEEQRIADARARVMNDPVYRNALEQAQRAGFSAENLQSIEDRGGGVQRLKFAQTSGGINQQFNPYVNTKTGASTPGLSSQFRSFGSDIVRDIGQFTKWSIAIAAVYTPMQKLGELITIMIDNESKLADATIAANLPFEKAGEIFDKSADAANRAGESINTTIDAYAQAIRAVGRYTSESEKSQKATSLLNDSLILSKLSALDQATAIDTLSAALIQSGRELDQGQDLLNKWVKVSQIANVSIDGLATGVAVLGDSAETVGLSIDQLNGLIAVLSEQSISGSKEAANTAKALVGAYQSDKAEAALNKYGIALRKANGEVRGFLEIYQELSKLRQEGVLSPEAVSEVALALGGGGVRRAKDASALINSTERLNNIAQESAKITGEDSLANDALSKKLETVQTANTRLANSFQSLAQTLGDDGGLLDLFKTMINLLTSVTKGADELFTLLGRSGPILASFTAGLVALNMMSAGRKETMLASMGARSTQFMGFMGGNAQYGGPLQNTPAMGYGKGLMADILRMNTRGGLLLGGAGVALQGAANIGAGRNEQALGNVAGGAIGAAIGAYLGGPPGIAIGANIGSAAGDALVTSMLTHKGDFASIFAPTPEKGQINTGGLAEFLFGRATTQPTDLSKLSDDELKKLLYQGAGGGNELAGSVKSLYKYAQNTPTIGGVRMGGGYANQNAAALDLLKTQNPALYQQFLQEEARRKAVDQANSNQTATTPEYDQERRRRELQATQERQNQLNRLATGQIGTAEYGRISNQLSGFPSTSIQSIKAYGDQFIKVSKDINNTEDAYKAFLYIATNGTQDQINLLSQYSNDINTLKGYIDKWDPKLKGVKLSLSFGDVTVESLDQLQKLMGQLQLQGGQAANATYMQVRMQQLKLPGIVGSATQATSGTDLELIKQQASKLQEQFYTDMNLTNDEIEHLKNGLEDFSVLVERAGQDHFETISGIDQKFWDAAQKLLVDQGKLKEQQGGIGFQQFDVPMSQLNTLAQRSLSIGSSWQKKYNYDFKPEDQIAIDNQGIVQPLHADFKILALLLEKLNEKAQKQLDGQYNIPEGATFWVPLTAAYYRNQGGAGGGDMSSMLNALDLKDNTGATSQNTTAIQNLTDAMQNRKESMVEDWQGKHFGPSDTVNKGYDRKINKMETAEGLASQAKTEAALGYRGDLGFGPRSAQSAGIQNPYEKFPGLNSSPFNKTQTQQVNPSPTTKLDLKFSSNVNLVVDGRVLATAMQSYMASELVRTEQSQGTVTKRYVI